MTFMSILAHKSINPTQFKVKELQRSVNTVSEPVTSIEGEALQLYARLKSFQPEED